MYSWNKVSLGSFFIISLPTLNNAVIPSCSIVVWVAVPILWIFSNTRCRHLMLNGGGSLWAVGYMQQRLVDVNWQQRLGDSSRCVCEVAWAFQQRVATGYHSEFADEWSEEPIPPPVLWCIKSRLMPSFLALVSDKFSNFFHRSSRSRSRFRSLKKITKKHH